MQTLTLHEYESRPVYVPLDRNQRRMLAYAHIGIEPPDDDEQTWVLHPSSYIGALNLGNMAVVVRPKIPVDRVMFLVAYALDPGGWRKYPFDLTPDVDVLEAVIRAFVHHARQAIRRGLLQGYRREEEALHTVRGRIRFNDQINRRFGIPLPLEVAFDEFTEDIEENRLLKTALHRLSHMPVRLPQSRRDVRTLRPLFNAVSLGAYPRGTAPPVEYTRLNSHYRPAVELARLIIENSSLELFHGEVTGASFVLDMNKVFQDFVTVALREKLGVSENTFRSDKKIPRVTLDQAGSIKLEPDLSWWESGKCTFVGDAKYKNITDKSVPESDIYQMLAYITALNLQGGMLIYAKGEADVATYQVRHAGKTIEVASLDLSGSIEEILAHVCSLACKVKALRWRTMSAPSP